MLSANSAGIKNKLYKRCLFKSIGSESGCDVLESRSISNKWLHQRADPFGIYYSECANGPD